MAACERPVDLNLHKPADPLPGVVGWSLALHPVSVSARSLPVSVGVARNPGRVRRLVIQTSYARGRAHRGVAARNQELDPFLGMLRSGAWGDPANGFMRAWVSTAFPNLSEVETTRMIEDFGAASTAEDMIASRLTLDRFDARADMAALDLPTLVIHPRNCSLHPVEEGRILAAGIARAQFLVVDGANVVAVPTDPTFEEQTGAVRDFLAGAWGGDIGDPRRDLALQQAGTITHRQERIRQGLSATMLRHCCIFAICALANGRVFHEKSGEMTPIWPDMPFRHCFLFARLPL